VVLPVMKLAVIACGVFEPYSRQLSEESPHQVDFIVLDAGLHERPNDLRILTQEEIDKASRAGYDAIVLYYGLCGRGTAGLESRDVPVVIPRVHDCISLFLGSQEAYKRQFAAHPGTFYHTLGWLEKKINPKHKEAVELYRNYDIEGYETHPDYAEMQKRFGGDNANFVLAFMDRWKKNYTRAAYIDLGFEGDKSGLVYTSAMADTLGWKHETIQGDPDYLSSLVSGDWDDERVFVLPPHSRSIHTGDDKVFGYASLEADDEESDYAGGEMLLESIETTQTPCGIGLGIDAGGTYTDAVIFDLGERKLLAKAKSLTTYHNLIEGISGALAQLPSELLSQVGITSLSTTLATNSIVEGRGYKVGAIALCPWDWTEDQIGHSPLINVPGAVSISGEVIEPLDEDEARETIKRLVETDHCVALAIGGYATIRNPEHANRVRDIASEMYDIPIVCSHEMSRRLNAIHGLQTAIANAKLIPIISDLIASVHNSLAQFGVHGKLMVVKGDGSPIDEKLARKTPVETILSGPAASVCGAKVLTGLDDALVLDIGGTTTDCAVIEHGHVAVSPDGARVGSWTMAVDAVEISTVGLGGDSRIDFDRDRKIIVGPRRNIPFAYAAECYPQVMEHLKSFDVRRYSKTEDASLLDVLVLDSSRMPELTARESRLIDLLRTGPVSVLTATWKLGLPSHLLLPLSRLESWGTIKRVGLTPTDILHVRGIFRRWQTEASELALTAFAAMYGSTRDQILEMTEDAVTRELFEEILRREVSFEDPKLPEIPEQWKFLLDKVYKDDGRALTVKMSLRRPVVAIGAPAGALVPAVKKHLDVEVLVPEHADVANAIGAICSETSVREEILIKPGHMSNYVLHGSEERLEFSELNKATYKAAEIARDRALKGAIEAGALSPRVIVTRKDSGGSIADGGRIFLERKITAVASGAALGKID